MCIVFDWGIRGIRLNDLIHTAGERVNSIIIQCVFISRVLLEYAYSMCFICFQWITYVQIVNFNKKYPELEAHETLIRVASANAILKTL